MVLGFVILSGFTEELPVHKSQTKKSSGTDSHPASNKQAITKILNSAFLKEIQSKISNYMNLCVVDIFAKKKASENSKMYQLSKVYTKQLD